MAPMPQPGDPYVSAFIAEVGRCWRMVHGPGVSLHTGLRLTLPYHASSASASIRITAARFSMRLLTVSESDWGSVSTR
jgi:hypothetical protein